MTVAHLEVDVKRLKVNNTNQRKRRPSASARIGAEKSNASVAIARACRQAPASWPSVMRGWACACRAKAGKLSSAASRRHALDLPGSVDMKTARRNFGRLSGALPCPQTNRH
jgi:hypothetical protein